MDSLDYNQEPNVKIDVIASDGNYQYHKIIKCKERKIVKVYKDKKTKKLLRDKEGNIIKDVVKKYYNNNIHMDCNKHIIDKAETCLVESFNGSLRNTFARFHRKTKAFSRNIEAIEYSLLIFAHKDLYVNNIKIYSNFGRITNGKNIKNEKKEKIIKKYCENNVA